MSDNKILNLKWPFFRYKAIIPNQLEGDVLVWLYLSLIVFINETNKTPRENYDDTAKEKVKLIINNKFSNIIDNQILDTVISNAERNYVQNNEIREETFEFLETFKNLFADTCETRIVYQDAVTGEVVPFFENTFGNRLDIDDSPINEEEKISDIKNTKEPGSNAVKRAYEQYMRVKSNNLISSDFEPQLDEDYYDEDKQTFWDNDDDDMFSSDSENEKKDEKKSLMDTDVIILPNSKTILNVKMPICTEDSKIVIKDNPFGKIYDSWFTKCLLKWKNISEQSCQKINELEKEYCISEEKNKQSFKESDSGDFAYSLKYCETLYRLIAPLNNKVICKDVEMLDKYWQTENKDAFNRLGNILEALIYQIKYNESTHDERMSIEGPKDFYRLFNHKFRGSSVEYKNILTNSDIFADWKRKFQKKKKVHKAFKADVADIILKTDIIKSPNIYDDFIADLFYLYRKRSTSSAHFSEKTAQFCEEDINKLTKAAKVLFELI